MTADVPVPTVVVPTVGRSSLADLLRSLADSATAAGARVAVVVVDDRRGATSGALEVSVEGLDVTVLRCGGRGPAAARNVGWRATSSPWVVFVDDDVVVTRTWWVDLAIDLESVGADVGAVQGSLRVPLPPRPATDWERQTAGLEDGYGVTADLAVRREALVSVAGFDERFRRAYREDADLALRLSARGWRLERGRRVALHPVRPAPWWISVARQAGNADDVLMDRVHRRGWRVDARAGRGRLPHHAAVAALTVAGVVLRAAGRPGVAAAALLGAGVGLGRFAAERISPGPRTPAEVAAMAATSVAIPYVAVAHHLAGRRRWRRARPWTEVAA